MSKDCNTCVYNVPPDTDGYTPCVNVGTFKPTNCLQYRRSHKKPKHYRPCRRNRKTLKLLEKWYSQPDDMGKEFWNEFDKTLGVKL